jgi:hypothetical protein
MTCATVAGRYRGAVLVCRAAEDQRVAARDRTEKVPLPGWASRVDGMMRIAMIMTRFLITPPAALPV